MRRVVPAGVCSLIDDPIDVWCSVVTYNTNPVEIERLAEIISHSRVRCALTIVDNSANLPALDLPANLTVERTTPGCNIGYGRGHNIAIARSKGRCRYHLVMNSDIVFDANVLDSLVAFMDNRPTAGLAMPLVRFPDGSLQHLCRLLPNPLVLVGRRFFGWTQWAKTLNDRYELSNWSYDRIASFPFLSGCFMFMRRSVLDTVVGFDPRFFLYAEDLDLSRRIHGVSETLFYPDVAIIHEYRSLQKRSPAQWRYALASLTRYFNKWGWIFDVERDRINRRALSDLAAQGSGLGSNARVGTRRPVGR